MYMCYLLEYLFVCWGLRPFNRLYVCVCTRVCTYVCTCVYMSVYVCTCVYMCPHVCTSVYIGVYVYICLHV